jgi:conjugative relaxase-like TrwC/TraI family protein
MALGITVINNADRVIQYHKAHYYVKGEDRGIWMGKMVDRLELGKAVTRKDFEAIMRNEKPSGERLTQRKNTTRRALIWEKDNEGEWHQIEKEVPNSRAATDFTLSLRKEQSVYLAASKDATYKGCAEKARDEVIDKIESMCSTRVRKGYSQGTRVTGESLFAVFEDRTTRPIDGKPDPHIHWHLVAASATYDFVENEIKAAEWGLVFKNKAYLEAYFHARTDELALDLGYGYRRTNTGLQLSIFDEKECRVFCKRTQQINALEKRLSADLRKQAAAIVEVAAKNGITKDIDYEYIKLKDELGEKSREGKSKSLYKEGPVLDKAWADEMAPGRWESLTQANAQSGESIGFLDPETAKDMTIRHVFDRKSRVRDVDLFKAACVYCAGSMRVKEIDAFCRTDPRLLRNVADETVTTHEIAAEEQMIRDTVLATNKLYQPLSKDLVWHVMDKGLDDNQLAAVKLMLETEAMTVVVPGYTGSGKSRVVKEAALAIQQITGKNVTVLAPKGRNAVELAKHTEGPAQTIALYRTDQRLHVRNSVIFVDEFSQVGNADCQWLLDHCLSNGNRLVWFGDATQYQATMVRGDPIADLLSAGIVDYRHLDKIYRQRDPKLLEVVTLSAERKISESVALVKKEGWFHVESNEEKLRAAFVDNLVDLISKGESVLAQALTHEHNDQIREDVRAKLKERGLIGEQDVDVRTLADLKLTEAEKSDPTSYHEGMAVKFHRLTSGKLRSGQVWEFERVQGYDVIIRRNGKETVLPVSQVDSFEAFHAKSTKLSVGDMVMFTKNLPTANVRTGDIRKIKALTDGRMTLDNGKTLSIKEGAHIRSGYTQSGFISQGDQADHGPIDAPASVSGMINQRSWHTAISRARQHMRVYTNCVELIEQRAPMPEDRGSALNGKKVPTGKPDLQAGKQKKKINLVNFCIGIGRKLATGKKIAVAPEVKPEISRFPEIKKYPDLEFRYGIEPPEWPGRGMRL